MPIWRELGLKRTRDRVAIAHAYAARLAEIEPETDSARADALRTAYQRAHRFCDAMETGPVPRIAPRWPSAARRTGAQDDAGRPRRTCPARAQEAGRAVLDLTCQVMAPLARGDRRGAVVALRGLFRDPLFGNLRLRWAVERRLLEQLGALDDIPVDFSQAALAAFRWEEDPRHLSISARAVVDRLRAIAESQRRIASLRRMARFWAVRMWVDRQSAAAALLTGPYRPVLFRLAMLDPLTARAVKRLLDELRARHAPTVARELDRRVVAWWDAALGIRTVPTPRTERAA
jgi:hypothetical protein